MAEEREMYLASGGRENGDDDPVKVNGVKRVSILFKLPYWAVSCHTLFSCQSI